MRMKAATPKAMPKGSLYCARKPSSSSGDSVVVVAMPGRVVLGGVVICAPGVSPESCHCYLSLYLMERTNFPVFGHVRLQAGRPYGVRYSCVVIVVIVVIVVVA